jgi:hypothetical protein
VQTPAWFLAGCRTIGGVPQAPRKGHPAHWRAENSRVEAAYVKITRAPGVRFATHPALMDVFADLLP